jgi:iron complex outermembrane receptor protein
MKKGAGIMNKFRKNVSAIALVTACASASGAAWAQTAPEAKTPVEAQPVEEASHAADNVGVAEIVVTARRRAENLQAVPDAITAFSSDLITNANISSVADLARLTPGLNFRDGRAFSATFFDVRMRGIGSAQGGWPSVSLIVDGIPNDSGDALTAGSLAGVERIEVLRGPQSALYGAGAIAGAINIVTKRPENEVHGEGRIYYGNGNDLQAAAAISGALIPDKVLVRLATNYRDDDGRIDSRTNGAHLDPHHRKQVEGRVIIDPTERFEADLRASYNKEEGGFAFQARTGIVGDLSDLINTKDPVFARRSDPDSAGHQSREFIRLAARLNLDLDAVELTSVSAYNRTRQSGIGSACFDDVDFPTFAQPNGSVLCQANTPAYGVRAAPGQVIERFQTATDNLDSYFQDLRVSSKTDGPINWLVGASGMSRKSFNVSSSFTTVAGTTNRPTTSLTVNERRDTWWGAYAQISANIGKLELTANGRYDNQEYENTTYTDVTRAVIVQVRDINGNLIDTQRQRAKNFQPKGQVSYHFDSHNTAYVTVSRGFRAGYFNAGAFAIPEYTTNYEAGLKTAWLDRRLIANIAAFHIDYSNQQLSQVTNTPPFRINVTVPKTTINGIELETVLRPISVFTLNANLSYLHAEISDGTTSPKAPRWSGSIAGQLNQPLNDKWTLNANVNLSFASDLYLFLNNTQHVPPKQYLNARIGLERERWGVFFVGRNLTNTQEPQVQAGTSTPYRVIYPADPRSYGVELRFNF